MDSETIVQASETRGKSFNIREGYATQAGSVRAVAGGRSGLLTHEKASCPFPNSSLRFPPLWPGSLSKISRELVRRFLQSALGQEFELASSGLPPRRLSPGSFLARPEFASIEEPRPFQVALLMGAIFEQRPRREIFGSSLSSPACLWGFEDAALSCRFSWLCPYAGHPSSLVAFFVISGSIAEEGCALPNLSGYFQCVSGDLFRARTLNQIGVPANPNASRI